MKKLAFFILFPFLATPQSGTPMTIFVGKMTCTARLITTTQLQTWCTKGSTLVHNTIQTILPNGNNSFAESFSDFTPGEPAAQITWIFFPVSGAVNWQATWQIGTNPSTKLLSGTLVPAK